MPQFGGLAPFPRRYGGAKTRTQTIVKSLQSQLAPKYDTADTSGLVWLRINAMARVIAGAWAQNARLANQWTPSKMSDFLSRWEKILALTPSPNDSLTVRRARVGVAMARVGEAMEQVVRDTCAVYLGDTFVGIANTSSASAVVWTPSTWPVGNHPSGISDPDWSSSTMHVVILTKQPSTMSDAEFFATAASVKPALDAILPSWVTFDVARDGSHGAGFYLDEPKNLNWERFA